MTQYVSCLIRIIVTRGVKRLERSKKENYAHTLIYQLYSKQYFHSVHSLKLKSFWRSILWLSLAYLRFSSLLTYSFVFSVYIHVLHCIFYIPGALFLSKLITSIKWSQVMYCFFSTLLCLQNFHLSESSFTFLGTQLPLPPSLWMWNILVCSIRVLSDGL